MNLNQTIIGSLAVADLVAGGSLGTNLTTVDLYSAFDVNQTTAGQTMTLANPTVTISGRIALVNNVGTVAFTMYGTNIPAQSFAIFTRDGNTWNSNNFKKDYCIC